MLGSLLHFVGGVVFNHIGAQFFLLNIFG
jgi:hypothetical protein